MTLHAQRLAWRAGFVLYAVLCGVLTGGCGLGAVDLRGAIVKAPTAETSRAEWVLWFLLPAVGAVQLCAVTSHLTQNVAAIPLLWVVPLAVYLLSFVLAFEFAGLYRRWLVVRLLAVMLASLGYLLSKTGVGVPIAMAVGFFVVELFVACWFLHAELYALRPQGARGLDRVLSVDGCGRSGRDLLCRGGESAGVSVELRCADGVCLDGSGGAGGDLGWRAGSSGCSGVWRRCSAAAAGGVHVEYARNSLVRVRNFYGTLRVTETHTPAQAVTLRTLVNGSIRHGMQWFAEDFRTKPMSYYAEDSGVGLAMRICCGARAAAHRRGGSRRGDDRGVRPARRVDRVLRDQSARWSEVARGVFTYLRESRAEVTVVRRRCTSLAGGADTAAVRCAGRWMPSPAMRSRCIC